MVCLFVVEAVLDDELLELGHFFAYFLGETAVQLLHLVDEPEQLVLHLTHVLRPRHHAPQLLHYVLVFLQRQHIIILPAHPPTPRTHHPPLSSLTLFITPALHLPQTNTTPLHSFQLTHPLVYAFHHLFC